MAKEGYYEVGDIVRIGDGPTAIMRISIVDKHPGGGIKDAQYYGQHVLGGLAYVLHRNVRRATPKDRELWYDEGRKTTRAGAPLRAPWKQFMEKYGIRPNKERNK